jgi:hypothetical protein
MPITGSVAWDGRLMSFKGRDTTQYVTTAADFAKTCGACRRQLSPGDPRSLIVEITQSISPDGGEHITFTDYVCHRQCSDPALRVQQTPWTPDELHPIAARMVLARKSATGHTRVVPVLAYTLDQVVSFRENEGEPVSALVSLLLSHGFQLAMSPDYSAILQQARQTPIHCKFTATPNGLLQLSIAGEILDREQLDLENADDAEWLHIAAQRPDPRHQRRQPGHHEHKPRPPHSRQARHAGHRRRLSHRRGSTGICNPLTRERTGHRGRPMLTCERSVRDMLHHQLPAPPLRSRRQVLTPQNLRNCGCPDEQGAAEPSESSLDAVATLLGVLVIVLSRPISGGGGYSGLMFSAWGPFWP